MSEQLYRRVACDCGGRNPQHVAIVDLHACMEPIPPCTEHRWVIPVRRVSDDWVQDYDRSDSGKILRESRGDVVAEPVCLLCGTKASEVQ